MSESLRLTYLRIPRPNIKTNTYYGLLPGLKLCPTESGTSLFFFTLHDGKREGVKNIRGVRGGYS